MNRRAAVDFDEFGRVTRDSVARSLGESLRTGTKEALRRHEIYDDDGNLQQVTIYDKYVRRSRQYDLGAGVRHGEGYHEFSYGSGTAHGRRGPHTLLMTLTSDYDDRYIRLGETADWDALLDLVAGFHDGVVREFLVREESYVDTELTMSCGDGLGAEASVVVQFQRSEVPALELVFKGVDAVSFCREIETSPGTATWDGDTWTLKFLACSIRARDCRYRRLDASYLGDDPMFWSREDRPAK